ncbi:MAG: hypothetical protein Q7R34_07790, partial [Dehalococcoidia bacterium]|nr:hypothetical protein [Dehalococcoidia bacterium]
REPEPKAERSDQDILMKAEHFRKMAAGKILIRGDDYDWEQSRHAYTKRYIWAGNWDKVATPGWAVFRNRFISKGGRHIHQGGIGLLALEGQGYTTVDGIRYDWEAGDLVMLPIKPGGVDHQHFNRLDNGYSEWIAFIYQPFQEIVGDVYIQKEFHPDWTGPKVPLAENQVDESLLAEIVKSRSYLKEPKSPGLLGDLIRTRNQEREQLKGAKPLIKGKELPLENNPLGLFRWYLHPSLKNNPTRAMIEWSQEIPPGSRSGMARTQGGKLYYVLEGKGYTILNGARYDWKKEDLLLIPHKIEGNVFQHFNADPQKRALLYGVEFNWSAALGIDMGCGFDILEPSPDFRTGG